MGPELLRRVLLGAVTALVVARPLVLGEDPGLLLRPWSDAWGLVLTLLWFVTALGGAVWAVLSGEPIRRAGLVEGALLAVVGLVFAGAAWSAAYQHPAWLIAWEWLALFLAFCLVRQLVRTPGENRRLLAALVASAVSLSAYAIYQYAVEFPQQRAGLASDEALRDAFARQRLEIGVDSNSLQNYRKRILLFDHVFATFSHPNSFAGFLALLLPAGVGWAAAAWRSDRRSWRTWLLAGCAALTASALWLTHSRGALIGTAAAVGVLAVIRGRHWLSARRAWVTAGAAAILVAGIALVMLRASGGEGVEKSRRSFGVRLDYWSATWHMLTDGRHPRFFWLGVGPGNFGRYYPRYMPPTASEEVKDPHNLALDVWATGGVFALAALLVALGAFFRTVWPAVRDPATEPDEGPPVERAALEFYLGGMAGLILGFILWALGRTGENAADERLIGGLIAAVRLLVWFAAFGLLERIPWAGRGRAAALTAGVAALLVNLTVSGGISFPSVALPLWVAAALALNALPRTAAERQPRYRLGSALAVPVLTLACLFYYSAVFVPVTDCTSGVQEARKFYGTCSTAMEKGELGKAARLLQKDILPPLEGAAKADPADAYPQLELAQWLGQLWLIQPRPDTRERALECARRAVQLDPEGLAGYETRCQLYTLFARSPDARAAADDRRRAVADMRAVVTRSPTHPGLRYQLAEILFQAGDRVEGREQAREAARLDELSPKPDDLSPLPTRKLSDPQREQIRKWLGDSTEGTSLPRGSGAVTIVAELEVRPIKR